MRSSRRWRGPAVFAGTVALMLVAATPSFAGQEIADLTKVGPQRKGPTDVLLATGSNPISAEEFETYEPPPGYIKNTERTAEFQDQDTLSSPGEPEPEVTDVTTSDGYTWIIVARTRSFMWPFRAAQWQDVDPPPTTGWEAAFGTATPPKRTIRYSDNSKNQLMYFWPRENETTGKRIRRYFVTDRWGNRYMMMATGAATIAETNAAFKKAVLPKGWTKSTGFFRKTVKLTPAYDLKANAHYVVWRDSADNSWVQVRWSKSGKGIAQRIGDTMPIWGGRSSDRLLGTSGNDKIHGAERRDTIVPRKGDDVVFGDGGRGNKAILRGKSTSYRVRAKSKSSLTLVGHGDRKRLDHIQRIRFADGGCSTSAIKHNVTPSSRGVHC